MYCRWSSFLNLSYAYDEKEDVFIEKKWEWTLFCEEYMFELDQWIISKAFDVYKGPTECFHRNPSEHSSDKGPSDRVFQLATQFMQIIKRLCFSCPPYHNDKLIGIRSFGSICSKSADGNKFIVPERNPSSTLGRWEMLNVWLACKVSLKSRLCS